MSRLVRIGFIGCGSHATNSLYPTFRLGVTRRTALGEPVGELVACCDLDEDKARHNARTFGFERWYTDHRQMLEREDLDGVFVIMPPKLQAPLAIECLEAGKPVFVEKPATATLEDAYAVKEASTRSGKPLMIGFMKRFSEPYRRARELMQRPEFGPPTSYEARYNYGQYTPISRYEFLNAFSCHVLDLTRYFMGDVEQVYASYVSRAGGANDRPKTYDEVVRERDLDLPQREAWLLNLHFASGAIGLVQTNCLERVQERVTLTGVGSWIFVDDWRTVKAYIGNTEIPYYYEPNDQMPSEPMDFRTLHGYTGEVRHFVECVRDGKVPTPNIDDGIAHIKIELAAKRSALENRPVAISEIA
ncbi:MAG TPA: Gfo/Idh/MocA family oxidoreductase [Gemmatimonadales bacterium]|nr:Gfo/Idh/MocA family oxidoreductase [Gemmatimonadales bacterium]